MSWTFWPILAVQAAISAALFSAGVSALVQWRTAPQSWLGKIGITIALAAVFSAPMAAANLCALPVALLLRGAGLPFRPAYILAAMALLFAICAAMAAGSRQIGGGPLKARGKLITLGLCAADAASIWAMMNQFPG